FREPSHEVIFSPRPVQLIIRKESNPSRSASLCTAATWVELLRSNHRQMHCLALGWKGIPMSLQLEGESIEIIDAHTHMGGRPRRERFEISARDSTTGPAKDR